MNGREQKGRMQFLEEVQCMPKKQSRILLQQASDDYDYIHQYVLLDAKGRLEQ